MSELVDKSKYQSYEANFLLGYILIFVGVFTWVFACYSIVFSKLLMPKTGHVVLDWIKEDLYYCCIFPSYMMWMVPLLYYNWYSMKYFRHAQ